MKYEKPTFPAVGFLFVLVVSRSACPTCRVPNPFALFAKEPALSGAEGVGAEI